MGCGPAASIASSTAGNYHSLPAPHFSVIPVIRRAARWWNAVKTLNISTVAIHLLLTYSSTDCATNFYIYTRDRTISPALSITLAIMPHHRRALHRLRYTEYQLLLL